MNDRGDFTKMKGGLNKLAPPCRAGLLSPYNALPVIRVPFRLP